MSKAKKHDSSLDHTKKKGKKSNIILTIFFVFTLVIVSILTFDLFGLKKSFVDNFAKDIPIVSNLILKNNDDEELNKLSKQQLISKIDELNKDLQSTKEENENTKILYKSRTDEINELNLFKNQIDELEKKQLEYIDEKKQFDSMVAKNDIKSFVEYYKKIDPENAEIIYKEIISGQINEKEVKKYIDIFNFMEDDSAAKILEDIISSDLELVVSIFKKLKVEKAATILANMQNTNASLITRRLSPIE